MNYLYLLCYGRLSVSDRNLVKELNKALKFVGVSIKIKNIKGRAPIDNSQYFETYICFDHDRFEIFKNMSMGRLPAIPNEHLTLSEVRKRLETDSAAELARELGISRATLFRRMKRAKEENRMFI